MRNLHLLADDWRRARTLFAVRGRAKPWFPLSIYVAYSCVVVTYMRWYGRTTYWLPLLHAHAPDSLAILKTLCVTHNGRNLYIIELTSAEGCM